MRKLPTTNSIKSERSLRFVLKVFLSLSISNDFLVLNYLIKVLTTIQSIENHLPSLGEYT